LSLAGHEGWVATVDGPDRRVAIDIAEQTDACYEIQGDCIGRIPTTIYAVGFDGTHRAS
jgi:hypothetical protein